MKKHSKEKIRAKHSMDQMWARMRTHMPRLEKTSKGDMEGVTPDFVVSLANVVLAELIYRHCIRQEESDGGSET